MLWRITLLIRTGKCQYILMCFDAILVYVSVQCQSVCVGFFSCLSLNFDFQCLFFLLSSSSFNLLSVMFTSLFFCLPLSSSSFSVLSVMFTSCIVAPHLLHAASTSSEFKNINGGKRFASYALQWLVGSNGCAQLSKPVADLL